MKGPMGTKALRSGVASGMFWAVVRAPHGGCNGYVKLPTGYPRAWDHYDDIPVTVHGGLTYGPDEDGWVGFDTVHLHDVWMGSIDPKADNYTVTRDRERHQPGDGWNEWDEDKVEAEVKSLAKGIADLLVGC